MTHPLTPREKVAQIISGAKVRVEYDSVGRQYAFVRDAVGTADAILTALASGSGDHAELARAIDRLLPITIHDTPDYAEVSFGECRAQAMTMEPDTWLALNQLPALIAENAALRAEQAYRWPEVERLDLETRLAEAERKLAEAREWIGKLDCECDPAWSSRQCGRCTFLSKEAERG